MNFGVSLFYVVCQEGYFSIVEFFLKYKVDVNLCKNNGLSFFSIVYENGYINIVEFLLKNGVNISCEIF